MKKLLFIAFSIFLFSCNTSVEGDYVIVRKDKDKIGNDESAFGKLTFGDKFCRVELYPFGSEKMDVNYEYFVDKDYIYIDTREGFGILALEIVNRKTLEGVGAISGTFKKE